MGRVMKKKKIWFAFLLMLILCFSYCAVCSAGWKYSKAQRAYRYYITKTKTYATAGWKKLEKKWYYFDTKGYVKTGRFRVGDHYFYCTRSAGRAQNKKVGSYYYGSDGAMVTNCWKKSGKHWFYFGSDGKEKTGRFTAANGKTYYCNKNTGRITKKRVGNYYYSADGTMVTNKWVGGYYYGSDGKAQYGRICVNGKYYYVYPKSGLAKNKWINKHFYNKNGVMVTSSWIKGSTVSAKKISGGTYVDETGRITQGNKNPKNPPSESDIKLLAALVYCEAGNQSYRGKVAVASVVINRMNSSKFPNKLRGVIYQSGQFEPVGTGWLSRVLCGRDAGYSGSTKTSCIKAATEVLTEGSKLKGYLYFNTSHGKIRIGAHLFS